MTKTQIDPQTGDSLLPFGVEGGTNEDFVVPYKKIRGEGVENDAIYLIKANASINTQGYSYVQTQLGSNKLHFLIDEMQARAKLDETKAGQQMTVDERNQKLMPFVLTTGLKAQMCNLTSENDGINIILKQSNRGISKDRFSSLQYGLYYIKQWQDKRKHKKRHSIGDFMFFS